MFCKNCGSKINEDTKFCPNCGEKNNMFVEIKKEESEIENIQTDINNAPFVPSNNS